MSASPPPAAPATAPESDAALTTDGTRLLVGAAALVIITWGAYQAQPVLVSLLVSIFFAILGTPPLLWLQRRRVPTAVAVLLVVSAMVLILLLAAGIVGASLTSFSAELPGYQERLRAQVAALQGWLSAQGVRGLALSNIVLVLLTIAFILLEVETLPSKLRTALGNPRQGFPQVTAFIWEIEHYVLIKTGISLVTGALVGAWLGLLGVDFAVLRGWRWSSSGRAAPRWWVAGTWSSTSSSATSSRPGSWGGASISRPWWSSSRSSSGVACSARSAWCSASRSP